MNGAMSMNSVDAAILRTVLYADLFNFPMRLEEIHHFLIADQPYPLPAVQTALLKSSLLSCYLECHEGYFIVRGRHELIAIRAQREASSARLWSPARECGRWLAQLPYVRMVGLTGSLAVRNAAADDDDLDYMVVTAPGRVWLARGFAVLLVRWGRLRGWEICPNFVIAETALAQSRYDIFMAHEVVQLVPVYGRALYRRFRDENAWVAAQMPNAVHPFYDEVDEQLSPVWGRVKTVVEWVLNGRLGDWLESWEYRRKLKRFAADLNTPHSAARLDPTQVKGHFNDRGHPVLHRYYQRLRECGIEDEVAAEAV